MNRIFIIISLFIILAGCANEATKIGNPGPTPLPEDISNATKIGNPSPMPLPEDPSNLRDTNGGSFFTKMYLSAHDWQGSSINGDIYEVKFEDGVATVASTASDGTEELAYKVADDGSVISEGEDIAIAGSTDKDSQSYPLDINLMTADGESIKLFAGEVSGGWMLDKLGGSGECVDTDAILFAQGNSYVKGLVSAGGEEFADYCDEGGKVLVEYVCTSKTSYAVEKTSCDCQGGRCTLGSAIAAYKAMKETPTKMYDKLKKLEKPGSAAIYFNTKLLGN